MVNNNLLRKHTEVAAWLMRNSIHGNLKNRTFLKT
jgi:hypothetical protein